MLHRKSKTQFVKQERNTQNAIALLNYLKRIALQQFCSERKFLLKIFYCNLMFRLILHFPRFEPMPSDFAAKVTATTLSEPIYTYVGINDLNVGNIRHRHLL
jgi:hypothetical protein